MSDAKNTTPMPRYKCHKEVWALQIGRIDERMAGGARLSFVLKRFAPVDVDQEWLDAKKPQEGGYYVVYKDGYQSYSPAKAFEEGYTQASGKTLNNTDAKGARVQVKDIEIWGDGDAWLLICKASSEDEGWMKSTKAMPVYGSGCLVQVTTQQGVRVSEAVTMVDGVVVVEHRDDEGVVCARHLTEAVYRNGEVSGMVLRAEQRNSGDTE